MDVIVEPSADTLLEAKDPVKTDIEIGILHKNIVNPYSCDWRSDKTPTCCNYFRITLKTIVLVVQCALYVIYLLDKPDNMRTIVCSVCGAMFYVRVTLQLVCCWSRRVPWLEVVAEALFIIPVSMASIAWAAKTSKMLISWDAISLCGVTLFALGSYINVSSEMRRCAWKHRTRNDGRLYTRNMFSWARHINYFGEVLSFVGLAIASGSWWNLWIPALMSVGMITWSIPELDWYLRAQYGDDEYEKWERDVPYKCIPLVY